MDCLGEYFQKLSENVSPGTTVKASKSNDVGRG